MFTINQSYTIIHRY